MSGRGAALRGPVTILVMSAILAAAAAGCDDDGGGGDPAARTETVERNTRVEVIREIGGDGRFDPARIYERDAPGVVTVSSVLGGGGGDAGRGRGQGVGSGFVIGGEGEIATNAHVVTSGEGEDIREAREVYVAFADGNEVPAEIVGFDPNSDVALLRIDPEGLTLRPLRLGTVRDLVVGSPVAAIGSPFGEPQSLSVGVVSATDRSIRSLTGFEIAGAVQTDAAINRGNSGGPLVNAAGEVLGINSQIQTTSGGGEGVGYAVPVDTVRRVLAELRDDGEIDYAFLGVATARIYPQLAERFDLPVQRGAWVQEVVEDGPADDAGLREGDDERRFQARPVVVGGDIITRVEGRVLPDEAALGTELERFQPGDEVTLQVYRDGRARDVEVTLGERPADSGRAGRP